MKKLLAMLCALALCMTAAGMAEGGTAPGNQMGLDLLAMLTDGSQNAFVSPVSLAYAMAMAADGAGEGTRQELLLALDTESTDAIAAWNDALAASGLKVANAAFVAPGLPFSQDYAQAISGRYHAGIFPLEDAAPVNEWVRKNTDGLIDKLLDEDMKPEISLLLMNAVAMDAKWTVPFDPYYTAEGDFHSPSGDVKAQFMHDTRSMEYARTEQAQAVRLRYRDCGLSMLLILPDEGRIAEVLTLLSEKGADQFVFEDRSVESIIDGVVAQQKEYDPQLNEEALRDELKMFFNRPEAWKVSLALPKLDITTTASLKAPLMDLGVNAAFSEDADFYGISDIPLWIDDVIQKVRVQVDEEGTRAAAVTEFAFAAGAPRYQQAPVPMVFDRPFIMLIADEATGAICFAGVVAAP